MSATLSQHICMIATMEFISHRRVGIIRNTLSIIIARHSPLENKLRKYSTVYLRNLRSKTALVEFVKYALA